MPIPDVVIAIPLPFSVSRLAIEPTIVTSRPSRIHTVPRPITTIQWKRDHGRRSSRLGTSVSMMCWSADAAALLTETTDPPPSKHENAATVAKCSGAASSDTAPGSAPRARRCSGNASAAVARAARRTTPPHRRRRATRGPSTARTATTSGAARRWSGCSRCGCTGRSETAGAERVQPPLAGHALQRGRPAILELEPRAGNEIAHGARDEHLSRARLTGDARADVDGDAGQLVADDLAFAGVDARPDLQPDTADGVDRRSGTANRARRPVEAREEAVTGGVDLAAAKALELA